MALPELEPRWPRPRSLRSIRSRSEGPLTADFLQEEDEDEKPQRPLLQHHPLAQKPKPQSLFAAAILFTLCCLASLWSWQVGHDSDLAATQNLVFEQGQYWRLFSTLLVHADIAHLLANSGLFLIFGLFLRNYFGSWAFPGLSLLGGMATGALALLSYPADVRLIGASGMVYFMAALWLMLFLRYADYLSWLHRWMRAIAFTLVVMVPTQFEPQVSYRTHAIGFALGIFFGWLSSPWMKPEDANTRVQSYGEDEELLVSLQDREEELLP